MQAKRNDRDRQKAFWEGLNMTACKGSITLMLILSLMAVLPSAHNNAIAEVSNSAIGDNYGDTNQPILLGGDYYGTINISWTAPGDDGNIGLADHYVIKYSPSPINNGNWDAATTLANPPAPISAGLIQEFIVSGLYAGRFYYLGIKTYDEAGNVSALSNIAGEYASGIPQPAPLGARVDSVNSSAVLVASAVSSHLSIFYEFALDTTAAFSGPMINIAMIADTTASVSFGSLLHNINYYWRCRAMAVNHSDSSLWSTIGSFSLDLLDTQAPQVTITSPSDGDTVTTDSVTISWQAFDNGQISQYYLGFSTDSGQNWQPLCQGTELNGSYNWLVPEIEGPIEIGLLYVDQAQNTGGDSIIIHRELTSSDDEPIQVPQGFALEQCYPNPFNATTTIGFTIPSASHVTLEIYDLLGNRVTVLHDDQETAGHHEYLWRAGEVSSGTYLYRIKAGSFEMVKKTTLLK
jgi:hypothetical protein